MTTRSPFNRRARRAPHLLSPSFASASRSAMVRACLVAIATLSFTTPVFAQLVVQANANAANMQTLAPTLPAVVVEGHYDNAVGTSDAASQGSVTAKLIESRPTLRPAEVLEFIPGVIVTQHSGDGKANQYFLRGFNLDHGTDFASFVDGMPVNMPTHAHGHGYSDLNWLIPELLNRIDYKKGPYFAGEGDFASAGAARMGLQDTLGRAMAALTLGGNGYARALVANTVALTTGRMLVAAEAAHNDGPWENPERFHRFNGVVRYSLSDAVQRTSVTAMAYSAGWNSTDQVPQRAVDGGLIGRFGSIDPTDGGHTSRYSLSVNSDRVLEDGALKFNVYAIRSTLDLTSDFTYNLENESPLNADQFQQSERRTMLGGAISRSVGSKFGPYEGLTTVGLQLRHDRLDPVGLYGTVAGRRVATTQESVVRQTGVGMYVENDTRWTPWLRTVAGLRADHFSFDVNSSIADNSGTEQASIVSPKLALVFGPWRQTEYFINAGSGFHSNDARGVTASVTAKSMEPTEGSPALVRSRGFELGTRTELLPGLQTSVALWQLNLDSELVFVGDAGETEASGSSKRHGVELNNHYRVTPWLLVDADLAISRARFTENQGDAPNAGRHVPGSVDRVISMGATLTDFGPWSGQLQLRYFGPRPLIEDNSQMSKATTLAYARVGYRFSKDLKLNLDVFNLFNRKASDIDYYYASRLPGEPEGGVNDIHFHPVEPRSLRLSLVAHF